MLISAVPLQTKSEEHYKTEHHIKIDNLDLAYDPFIQYTIKSQAFNGDIYTISGEFVLVDTELLHWWQTWYFELPFAIGLAVGMVFLGKRLNKRERIRRAQAMDMPKVSE